MPSILRVKAGDPANSYLVQKLEGHAAVGAQMPFGGPPLPAATLAVIRQWISDGALRTAAAAASGALTVAAAVPATGDVLPEAPAQVVLELSAELDQTRIDATSVRLERLVPGAEGPLPQAVAAALAPVAGNPRALLVVPRAALGEGRYRVVVGAPPDTGLASVAGERLGDAAGGGTVVTEFEVARQP